MPSLNGSKIHLGACPLILFVLAWFIVAALVYLIAEGAQKFLYDQTTEWLILRAIAGAAPLAFLLIRFPCQFDEVLLSKFPYTLMHCAAWFLVFWLVVRFQWPHALVVGVVSFFLTFWMVSLLADSLVAKKLPSVPTPSTLPKPATTPPKK